MLRAVGIIAVFQVSFLSDDHMIETLCGTVNILEKQNFVTTQSDHFRSTFLILKQEVMGRLNRLLSFDMARSAQKTKNWNDIQTRRQQDDLIRFISLKKVWRHTD
jgi:hypothetical protein